MGQPKQLPSGVSMWISHFDGHVLQGHAGLRGQVLVDGSSMTRKEVVGGVCLMVVSNWGI